MLKNSAGYGCKNDGFIAMACGVNDGIIALAGVFNVVECQAVN